MGIEQEKKKRKAAFVGNTGVHVPPPPKGPQAWQQTANAAQAMPMPPPRQEMFPLMGKRIPPEGHQARANPGDFRSGTERRAISNNGLTPSKLFPNTTDAVRQTSEAYAAMDAPVTAEDAGRFVREGIVNTGVGAARQATGLVKDVGGPLVKPWWDFGKGFLGLGGDSGNGQNNAPAQQTSLPASLDRPTELPPRAEPLPDPPAGTTHQDGRRAPFYPSATQAVEKARVARGAVNKTRRAPAYTGMADDPETVQVIRGMDRYNQNPNHFGVNFLPGTTGTLEGDIEQAEIVKRGGSIEDAAQLRINRGTLDVNRGNMGANQMNARTNRSKLQLPPVAAIMPNGQPGLISFNQGNQMVSQLPGVAPLPSAQAAGQKIGDNFKVFTEKSPPNKYGEQTDIVKILRKDGTSWTPGELNNAQQRGKVLQQFEAELSQAEPELPPAQRKIKAKRMMDEFIQELAADKQRAAQKGK